MTRPVNVDLELHQDKYRSCRGFGSLRDDVRRKSDLNHEGDSIAVAANHARSKRGFVVVAHQDVVAGLRVKRRIAGAGAVRDPALHDEIGSDAGGVVPEVVGTGSCFHDDDRRVVIDRSGSSSDAPSVVTSRSHVTADSPGSGPTRRHVDSQNCRSGGVSPTAPDPLGS